jgi:MFS superfamily sulfate permease-like transporter
MIIALRARRHVSWLRLLLALTAVPAVLAGLLAMHVLSGSTGETSSASHHAVAVAQPADPNSASVGIERHEDSLAGVCGPDCEREHQLSAVACVLALLAAAFALAIGTGWFRMGWLLRPVRYLSILTRSPAEPAPPSLLVLSISRT